MRLTPEEPTAGGDSTIEMLTNRPAGVTRVLVATLCRRRWTVEARFGRSTTVLKCEVDARGYPPAASLGFCVAWASRNAYAGVGGALRRTHGAAVAAGVSDYHLALDVSSACRGLAIAVPGKRGRELGAGRWSGCRSGC